MMRRGLRGRFTLWFGVAALVPIAATAAITWTVVSSRYRDGFDRTFRAADDQAKRAVRDLEESVESALAGIASTDNSIVGGILVDLRKGAGISQERRAELRKSGPSTMRMVQADVLVMTLPDDAVLVAPHNAAQVGEADPEPRRLARTRPGEAVVGWAKVVREGKVRSILVEKAARTISDHGEELTVLVGREIGAALLDRLERDGEVEARLVDGEGSPLGATEQRWNRLVGEPSVEYPLRDADGRELAALTVVVPDDALQETLRQVAGATALLGALAVLAAVALGFLVARRMTRDLDAVVTGAQAVSRGDLEHQVPVRGRDEIGEVAAAFNAMTGELRDSKERLLHAERVAAWQDIARSLAHEIKNPLTPIQMSVETMRRSFDKQHPSFGEIFDESTRTILEEVSRLKKIVGEFSQFARLPKPEKRPCDLNEIVQSALTLYRGAVRVVEDLEPALPPLDADKDQLTQVVLNLLENARDAVTARGSDDSVGRISVRTRRKGAWIELEVEDNGPGFDPGARERLFTPYFTTKETGTGLGLSIAQRIVAEHGGKISAASDPGKGARFLVEIPWSTTASGRAASA